MTNEQITRLLRMAILMLENMSKDVKETEDMKDINELIERLNDELIERLNEALRAGSNDELR